MGFLLISMLLAAATSYSVYADTASLLSALFAYSFVGTVTLTSSIMVAGLAPMGDFD